MIKRPWFISHEMHRMVLDKSFEWMVDKTTKEEHFTTNISLYKREKKIKENMKEVFKKTNKCWNEKRKIIRNTQEICKELEENNQ